MKRLITLILTLVLTVGAVHTGLFAVGKNERGDSDNAKKETPIAALPNDDYVPYQYRDTSNKTAVAATQLALNFDTTFKPITKTITVMTTATGDAGRGNVVYLKQPSDDIEIYAAMLYYMGEYNILNQPITKQYTNLYSSALNNAKRFLL